QILRETLVWHEGGGGSPTVVASVMSGVTAVSSGNGPVPGITSAPAHTSLAGGAPSRCARDSSDAAAAWRSRGGATNATNRIRSKPNTNKQRKATVCDFADVITYLRGLIRIPSSLDLGKYYR